MTSHGGDLVEDALRILRERLPPDWTVEQTPGQGAGARAGDAQFDFRSQSGSMVLGTALVEARPSFTPADVERLFGMGLTRRLREVAGDRPILVVSDFLSARTRELLAEEGISYLDRTGNVRLVMRNPPLFIETTGAQRRPGSGRRTRSRGLAGPTSWRVLRFLAEVDPPYGVKDIEQATGVSRGWVSRVLERLADEALIQRRPRRPVESVDWPELLRLRGRSVDLFQNSTTRTYIASGGAGAALSRLAPSDLAGHLVVTGSFAAVRVAPVAAAALLALYLVPGGSPPDFDRVADRLDLLPADEGPDVALLWPSNPRPVEDRRSEDGLSLVNLPQLVVDCLGGTGRMPAEGEAVLEWMAANVQEWRYPSMGAYLAAKGARAPDPRYVAACPAKAGLDRLGNAP